MTTIFEQLAVIGDGGVTVKVDAEVGNLAAIGTAIGDLVAHPSSGIDDLRNAVRLLPLPDLTLGSELPATLNALTSAIPTDLSSITGGLTSGIETIGTTLTGTLVPSVTRGLQPFLELHRLLELDHSCLTSLTDGAPSAPPPSPLLPPAAPGPPAAPPGAARAAVAIGAVNTSIAALPSPITVVGLLRMLSAAIASASSARGGRLAIPIFDDLGEGLGTLLRWNDAPDEIAASLTTTLDGLTVFVSGSLDAAYGTLDADAAAVGAALQAQPLAAILDGLVARLGDLRVAADDADAEAAAAAIDAHMDTLQAAVDGALTPDVLDRLTALGARLDALPGEIVDQLAHVSSVLGPPVSLPPTFPGPDPIITVDDEMADALRALVSPIVGWLQDVAMRLDLSLLAEPIATAASTAGTALDAVDISIASVTGEVQHLFSEVEQLVDTLDTAAIAQQFEDKLDAFAQTFSTQLETLFAPVRDLVAEAMKAIDGAVTAFDPATITDALQAVIGDLAGVLDGPEVTGARQQIEAAFASAEQAVGALSFAPVTDGVVEVIDGITAALKALVPGLLSAPLQLALQGAVALLPSTLKPSTDPLLAEMQAVVASGPAALVEQARAPVAQLQEAIRAFEPAALVGNALGGPFDDAVAQLDAFKPSGLLEPLNAELEQVKRRLRDELRPQRLLAPLDAPFAAVMAAFDQLDPHAVVDPLQQAIHDAVEAVLAAVPIDDLLAPVGAVLDAVQGVMDVGQGATALLHTVSGILGELEDGPAQVQAFADGVLAKLATVDAATLQPHVDALATAVAATTQAALAARAATAVGPLDAALTALGARDRLAAVTVAHRAATRDPRPGPASVTSALDRADPLKPELAVPYQALAAFQRRAAGAGLVLATELADATARLHAPGGTLASIATLQATPESLARWVREAVQPQVVNPLRALLAPTAPLATMLAPLLGEVEALLATLAAKLAAFGTAPGSAGDVKHTIDELLRRLRGLDLAFLSTSLDDLFAQVRGKLTAIGPAALAPALAHAFETMLGTLDVDTLLPTEQIAALDESVAKIAEALRGLDPRHVVAQLQPVFEQQVLPLIEAFDLGGLLDALVATLHGLRDELAGELERVDTAYQAMLAAVPPFNPLSIDIDIDIDVDVDVGGFL